jgi:hypothetical protein
MTKDESEKGKRAWGMRRKKKRGWVLDETGGKKDSIKGDEE